MEDVQSENRHACVYCVICGALQCTLIMLTDQQIASCYFYFFIFLIFLFSTHVTDPWIDSPVTNLCQEHLGGLPDLLCTVNYLGFLTDEEVQPF